MQQNNSKLILYQYEYAHGKYPVISLCLAAPYESDRSVVDYLTMQMTMPVRWLESMNYLMEESLKL